MRRDRAVCALIALAILVLATSAHSPVLGNGFSELDDPTYVTDNARVLGGLTPSGAAWALTATRPWTWHPLTWLSHMADVSLWGLDPRGHHASSLALHAASAAALFLLLAGLTGWRWRAAGAAALLAAHPVHVESVAWVAERKGILSSFLLVLALLAYLRYARRPGPTRYALVLAALAGSLMAKQMAMTLPALLLLLDFWPLGRWRDGTRGWRRLVLEKLPLFALGAAAGALVTWTQKGGGAVMTMAEFPLRERLANAATSCVAYLGALLWPAGLAVFYPHPGPRLSWAAVAASAAAVTAALAVAAAQYRRRPWLLTGLAWYLVALVPVLGLVQIGWHARADRYAYVPFIGLYLVLACGTAEFAGATARRRAAAGIATLAVIVALGGAAWRQERLWRDDVALFEHAIAVTGENWFAESNLGGAWIKRGRMDLAIPHFREAVRLNRSFALTPPPRPPGSAARP